ncbi:hypothetical protein C0995_003866, partial [Termitomyces sp. Mi166
VVMGLGVLGLIDAILLIDIEATLSKNSNLVETGETAWTFGQTLAILVLLVPLCDLLESVLDQGAQKQRRHLLLSAVNGAKGMVEVLLDLEMEKKDLSEQIAEIQVTVPTYSVADTLFCNRCAMGDLDMVKFLVKNGADKEEQGIEPGDAG